MSFGQREVLAEKGEDGCELPASSALRCPQDAQACPALFLPPSNVNCFLRLPACLFHHLLVSSVLAVFSRQPLH